MGQNCSSCEYGNDDIYLIETKTGDIKGMGSLSTVYITLVNTLNECSDFTALNGFFLTAFRKGSWDRFKVEPKFTFLPIKKIIIGRRDDDISEAWFLEMVRICRHPIDTQNDVSNMKKNWQVFPVQRWIKCNQFLSITEGDCVLPQLDENKDQRICELTYNQSCYRYNHIVKMPPQCLEIPTDEIHSNYSKWDIIQRKIKIYNQNNLHEISTNENFFNDQEQLALFSPEGTMKKPNFLMSKIDDVLFIYQRLGGCYPNAIKICKEIPSDIKIASHQVEPFLEGFSLTEAMEKDHIFCVDHRIMTGIRSICTGKEMPIPFALFYIDRLRKHLRVIAIQLTRNEIENEVFLPSDPQPIWVAAKMWFNNSEAIIHKSTVLVGNSHMLLESIATSIHRQLSPSHPVFRLIIFAIKDVIPINNFEILPLTKLEGFLHRTTNIGSDGCMKLIERGWAEWRMDVQGWLPQDLKSRGVDRTDILPHYPFRDDALLLFEAFQIYVKEILAIYYDDPKKLKNDWEIQNWAKELICESTGSIKSVFGNGAFNTLEELEKTLTSIIYLSFIYNSAISLPQYDNTCSFTIYSTLLMGEPPKHGISSDNWPSQNSYLPSKSKCLEMLAINLALSERDANGLGSFNCQYLFDKEAVAAKTRLIQKLRQVSQIISDRNTHRSIRYNYLNPMTRKQT